MKKNGESRSGESSKKTSIQVLNKEDFIKDLIKGIKKFITYRGVSIGTIVSLGIFIVALVSVFIAAYSFASVAIIKKLDSIETKQATSDKYMKTKFEELKTEIRNGKGNGEIDRNPKGDLLPTVYKH